MVVHVPYLTGQTEILSQNDMLVAQAVSNMILSSRVSGIDLCASATENGGREGGSPQGKSADVELQTHHVDGRGEFQR